MSTALSSELQAAHGRFAHLRLYLSQLSAADKLWKQRLTSRQRDELGTSIRDTIDKHNNAIGMWMYLHQVNRVRAVIELGESFGWLAPDDVKWLLDAFGEMPRDANEAQDCAIAQGDLVLEMSSRSVFWKGELLEIDWHHYKSSWEFLVVVCEHAKRGEPIDHLSFGRAAYKGIVSNKKNRLKAVPNFPSALMEFFRPSGTGAQQFTLPKDQIHVFD